MNDLSRIMHISDPMGPIDPPAPKNEAETLRVGIQKNQFPFLDILDFGYAK